MTVFLGFAAAANLKIDPDSSLNAKPPQPDIACTVAGAQYFFELGEITDESLAKDVSTSLRTEVDSKGGFFSEEEPLIRMIRKKAATKYETNGAPLDLILHYDKQSPFAPVDYLRSVTNQTYLLPWLRTGRFREFGFTTVGQNRFSGNGID